MKNQSLTNIVSQGKCLRIVCARQRKYANLNVISPGNFLICNQHQNKSLTESLCTISDRQVENWFLDTKLQTFIVFAKTSMVKINSQCLTKNFYVNSTDECETNSSCCLSSQLDKLFGKSPCRMDYHCETSEIYIGKGSENLTKSGKKLLITFVFLLGFIATFGNTAVVINSGLNLYNKRRSPSKEIKAYNILLLHLGIADFLMGIYMLGVTGGGLEYVHNLSNETNSSISLLNVDSSSWLSNNACLFLGVLNFLSSQVSVTALVTITGLRLFGVCFPYKKINFKLIISIVFFTWMFWILISCVPLFEVEPFKSNFADVVKFPNNKKLATLRYSHIEYTLRDIMSQVNNFCGFSKLNGYGLKDRLAWTELFGLAKKLSLLHPNDLKDVIYLSYYSVRRVCAPRFLVHFNNKFFYFTAAILAYNTLSFTFIFVAQIIIAKKSFVRPNGQKRGCFSLLCLLGISDQSAPMDCREKENQAMRKRMFLIVVTDFCCWIPISVFSIYYTYKTFLQDICAFTLYRKYTENWFYIFVMVVVPFNSVINPFIYSYSTRKCIDKLLNSLGIKKFKCT